MADLLQIVSPFDGHFIREFEMHGQDAVEKALGAAYSLHRNGERLPVHKRVEILEKAAASIHGKAEVFAREAAEEGGKPLIDSRVELNRAVQGIREAARSIPELSGREIPMNLNPASMNRVAFTIREPIGVVAAISAFNHPFNLIVHQAVTAIAVGCPVIVKPASATPTSCYNLVNSLYEAGLPEDWCRIILCGREEAERLATDPRVAFLSFIGSGEVGWSLRSKLAPGTRCALEHGGVAPVIVEQDADLEDAIPLIAKGGFYHAGQVCVSVQRVYVHGDIVDRFTEKLSAIAKKLVVGDPLDEKTEVGPLITEKDAARVHEWVKEAEAAGGKVVTGGRRIGRSCYEPTVVLDPPDDVKLSTSEVFGPVIAVYGYRDRDEAIERANSIPYSFQAAVFTRDIDTALDTAKRLEAAAVMINYHTAFRVDWMPFGGRKGSGLGVGGILPTMKELTEEKLMVIRTKPV